MKQDQVVERLIEVEETVVEEMRQIESRYFIIRVAKRNNFYTEETFIFS